MECDKTGKSIETKKGLLHAEDVIIEKIDRYWYLVDLKFEFNIILSLRKLWVKKDEVRLLRSRTYCYGLLLPTFDLFRGHGATSQAVKRLPQRDGYAIKSVYEKDIDFGEITPYLLTIV